MKTSVTECYILYETFKNKYNMTFIYIMDILTFNKDINHVLETDTFYDNGNFLRKGGE